MSNMITFLNINAYVRDFVNTRESKYLKLMKK